MSLKPACQLYVPQLSPFVDGELAPKDRVSVEQHLSACTECSGRVADFRAESGLVRVGLEMLTDDVDFSSFSRRVMAGITPGRPPLLERLRLSMSEMVAHQRGALMGGFAAAAVVLVVGVGLLTRPKAPEGYAASEVAVNAVAIDEQAHVAPVVMKEDKDTIIWLVDHEDRPGVRASPDSGKPSAADAKGQVRPAGEPARPKGGEL